MVRNNKFYFLAVGCAVCLLFGSRSVAQSPQPNTPPNLSLIPLVLVNVALDGIARPFSSPTGGPLPTPEFSVPRDAAKVFEIHTRDGNVNVNFSHSLPAGVPATAFEWVQASAPAPNATGRLRYNGCASCPASFTISVSASSNRVVSGPVKLNLTASNRKPELTVITRNGGTEVEPRYEIRFASGTFYPSDSQAVATYAGNLKYRLIPENSSNFGGGSMFVVIPRLKASRSVQVFLRNSYGSSNALTIQLPLQQVENGPAQFNCINCSTVFGNANIHDEYSIKHSNPGIINANGTDEITITPLRSGATPCGERDFIYNTALVKWIDDNGNPGNSAEQGTVTVSSQPPVGQLLRSPQNKIRIAWTLKPFKVDRWYQVIFGVIDVVGVCSNRVVQ